MIFSLDVRRARKGDCLLLHWGSREDPGLILVDGGPAGVYGPQLAPRLRRIGEVGPTPDAPVSVDLLMVSHIDDDHIHGLLDFLAELGGSIDERRRPSAQVAACWHNAFDDLIGNAPGETAAAVATFPGGASLDEIAGIDGLDHDAAKVLASIGQGRLLRDHLRKLGVPLNPHFGGTPVLARAGAKPIELGRGLTLTVVGPMLPELDALRARFAAWIKERGADRRSAAAALAAFSDRSVPNLSSIVVLAEAAGKRMLLTGDARGDRILDGLGLAGLLPSEGRLHVDVLKVPHHGSANNMETEFFRRVTADHYVFSGNGQHGNPERETFAMLFDARPREPFTIHLTYPVETIDAARELEWAKQRKDGRRARDWRAAEDGLATFFAGLDLTGCGQRILLVPARTPHVIDLLDPLGF